ncbi:MAG: response regulator [Lachnospiraceae bacterium]|nr:response regulator [Lachnospiraceae bacterium]
MYSIMILDNSEVELVMMQKSLEKEYSVMPMNNSKQALARLNKANIMPDIIILDVVLQGVSGFEVLTRLKTAEKTKNIRVIFISGDKDSATEVEAYRMGAADYIRKPVNTQILKKHIEVQVELLESKKQMGNYSGQLQQSMVAASQNTLKLEYFIIGVITDLITVKDTFAGMSSLAVSRYMGLILREMLMSGINYGIDPADFELIILSSQLHDMGKIGIPDSILQKTGKYTDEEFEMMKRHTVLAANAIQRYSYLIPNSKFLNYTYQMARFHHERYDGGGYPDHLMGANIPLLARILAVADTYDALVSTRSYRQAKTHEQAYNIITQAAGLQFDPTVVSAFQRAHMEIYEMSRQLEMLEAKNRQQQMSAQAMTQMPPANAPGGAGK